MLLAASSSLVLTTLSLASYGLALRQANCMASIGSACPPTWSLWGAGCYKLLDDAMSWSDAKEACEELGSELALPGSEEETWFLVEMAKTNFWINCNDLDAEGFWDCLDYPTGTATLPWATGQPDNDYRYGVGEHCVLVWPSGQWNDAPCFHLNLAICQRFTLPQLHL